MTADDDKRFPRLGAMARHPQCLTLFMSELVVQSKRDSPVPSELLIAFSVGAERSCRVRVNRELNTFYRLSAKNKLRALMQV